MPETKPEELVARLYEQGMSDNEVRDQLIEFGLSGREIHVLIKKAKEIRKQVLEQQKKVAKHKPIEVPPKQESMDMDTLKFRTGASEKPFGAQSPAPIENPPKEKKEKKSFFSGIFGKKGNEEKEAKPKKEAAPKPPKPIPVPEPKKEKKSGFSLFKKKEKGALERPQESAKPEKAEEKPPKKDKDRESQRPSEQAYQSKTKRLALIKEEISKPVFEAPPAIEVQKEQASAQEKTEEQRITSVVESVTKKTKALIPEDENKMDEEIARKLTDGMENLEKEMGELKELLETLRELNIKLIEIVKKR